MDEDEYQDGYAGTEPEDEPDRDSPAWAQAIATWTPDAMREPGDYNPPPSLEEMWAAEPDRDELDERRVLHWLDTRHPDPGPDLSFAEAEPEAARAREIAEARAHPEDMVPDRLVAYGTLNLAGPDLYTGWTVFERFARASRATQNRVLAGLSAADRDPLIMAANGYTPREIAQATRRPLKAVQAALTGLEARLLVDDAIWTNAPRPS